MDSSAKKILYIDLYKGTADVKFDTGLKKYLGGIGMGLKILSDNLDQDPLIFSVGPLNGYFPFCSKTSVVTNDNGVIEDVYIGGSLSSRIKFAGLDSIVLLGGAKKPVTLDIQNETVSFKPAEIELGSLGLPGKRSIIYYDNSAQSFFLDKYFTTPEKILEKKLIDKNVFNIVITGSKVFEINEPDKYEELYKKILGETDIMRTIKGNYPSCVGCPMGCNKSQVGEIGGNVLTHSLVACDYAENIFSDVGITFSCLNFLGYDYTHEDIENFPHIVKEVLEELNG